MGLKNLLTIMFGLFLVTDAVPTVSGQDLGIGEPFVMVLGIAQDAGSPQAGCQKDCCKNLWNKPASWKSATSIAIVDPKTKQRWLIECTPNFPKQLNQLDAKFQFNKKSPGLDGIFLTHAHIGHYGGLMHLGREVIGSKNVPVFCMPRMRKYLQSNGPWNQLVKLKNIDLVDLKANESVKLNKRISVQAIVVPHRGEYSETVGFKITGPKKTVFFLPDIDKWEYWTTDIESIVKSVDIAFLDGTFYDGNELPGRDISKIPHPFVSRSLQRFSKLPAEEKSKIHFIHFNHSNPILKTDSKEHKKVLESGFRISKEGMTFKI